jgi:hypothetical protein
MPDSKLIIPRDIALLSSDDVYKALDSSGMEGINPSSNGFNRPP